MKYIILWTFGALLLSGYCSCEVDSAGTVEDVVLDADLGESREASRTDADAIARESDSLTPDQLAALRDNGDAFTFQTEVSRVMKLIINSLYRNKEIFLRELISNASDALDKIRLLSLTDSAALDKQPDLVIRIKADKESRQLHIEDTGIGMTRQDLVNNLGTIAKSGTADFLSKMQESQSGAQDLNDMIGQFGVGFYSAFLVAERVTVTSKNNDDDAQHVWTSDADKFSVAQDPRGNTLERGTRVTLHLKQEAADYLQPDTIKNLVKKYSQFINFPIYLWASREETITIDDEDTKDKTEDEDEDAQVEEVKEEDKKTKTTTRTVWEWQLMNDNKPLWTRKPADVRQDEYDTFYRALTRDKAEPLAHAHFVAEGEVSFRALLFVPKVQPAESFNRYGTRTDNIKLYVRRVFISDEFSDLMPNYLAFIQGIVDSDDLPLNMSRETLQQHKLMKIIKKKLVRKVLDMLKKIPADEYHQFWKEYSTNIKLGVMEDPSNRSRLAKLLMFYTSNGEEKSFLSEYVSRMKPKQDHIYYIAGASKQEVQRSPFAERLTAKGYEVLYLTEPVDEYCISSLPEYDGKKFQNVAKEMFNLDEDENTEARWKEMQSEFEPLTQWMSKVLSEWVTKVQLSRRLSKSPAALVATMFGWSGNMERLAMSNAHQKADDAQRKHHLSQKKVLEINPRHPLIKELLKRSQDDSEDPKTREAVLALHRTAALRSGFMLHEGQAMDFAQSVEKMLHRELGIEADAEPEVEIFEPEVATDEADEQEANEHEEL